MKLQIQIPDAVYETYASYAAPLQGRATIEEVISSQVERFAAVKATDRILVVDSKNRAALETLLNQGASINSPTDLVARVDRLARIEVGEVRVPFTASELEELSYRARNQHRPIAELVADAVANWHEGYFNWPDTRVCPQCDKRIAAGEARRDPLPARPVAPPASPPQAAPPPVDIAGKVAVTRAIPSAAGGAYDPKAGVPAAVGGAFSPEPEQAAAPVPATMPPPPGSTLVGVTMKIDPPKPHETKPIPPKAVGGAMKPPV